MKCWGDVCQSACAATSPAGANWPAWTSELTASGAGGDCPVALAEQGRVGISHHLMLVDHEGRPEIPDIGILDHHHTVVIQRQPAASSRARATAWSSPWMVSCMTTIRRSSGAMPARRNATYFAIA